jgi:hypothetical protein
MNKCLHQSIARAPAWPQARDRNSLGADRRNGERAELRGSLEIKDLGPFDKDIVPRHAWSAHLLRRLLA